MMTTIKKVAVGGAVLGGLAITAGLVKVVKGKKPEVVQAEEIREVLKNAEVV